MVPGVKGQSVLGAGPAEGIDVALLREQPSALAELGAGPSPGSGWPRFLGGMVSLNCTCGPCSLPLACCGQPAVNCCCWLAGHPLVCPGLEPSTLPVRPVLPQLQLHLSRFPRGLSSHHWLQKPLGPRPSQLQAFTKTRLPRCRMNWGEAGDCLLPTGGIREASPF